MNISALVFEAVGKHLLDLWAVRDVNKEKIDKYYNLYFATKRRTDISKKAKSRLKKYYEGEWRFWVSMQDTLSLDSF